MASWFIWLVVVAAYAGVFPAVFTHPAQARALLPADPALSASDETRAEGDRLEAANFQSRSWAHETAVAVGVGLCLVLVAVAIVLRERHHRRRVNELLRRLALLEGVWGRPTTPGGEMTAPPLETAGGLADQGARRPLPRGPLSSLISALRRNVSDPLPGPERLDFNAIQVLYSRLSENTTPAELAAAVNMSLRTLQRGLSRALGCTPSELIIAVKMHEAKRLLAAGHHQVQEVARAVGYGDPFYFTRRFRAYYRMAPSEVLAKTRDQVA